MVNAELEQLKNEHARLHVAIEKLVSSGDDDIKLTVMKKRKLWIKDKISHIENNQQLAQVN
tara:strand:+ start:256 stop:438 length:183 start_codon:yes stop_codon:yes gene_type:complete